MAENKNDDQKWYQTTWFTILCLILFFPLGLVLMWMYKKNWKTWVKVVVTVFFSISFIGGAFMDQSDLDETQAEDNTEQAQKNEQKDKEKQQEKNNKEKEESNDNKEKQQEKNEKKSKEDSEKQKQNDKFDQLKDEREKIAKEVKHEVMRGDLKSVKNENDEGNVVVVIGGTEGITDKETVKGFREATSQAVYGAKKSGVDINNLDINIFYTMTDGINKDDEKVLSTSWDKETIESMNEEAVYTLADTLENHAEDFYMHPGIAKHDEN
ncbi:hypothetical protein ACSBRB_10090 [Staphylococcus auricularis]|uniref:hypothetical protein n=1 Tax=Staphylococcus auricularis TaxID=29379 RepID=UPI003EBE4300